LLASSVCPELLAGMAPAEGDEDGSAGDEGALGVDSSDGDEGALGVDSSDGDDGALPPLVGAARGGMALARAPLLASRENARVWAPLPGCGRGGLAWGRGGSLLARDGLVAAAEGTAGADAPEGDETAGDETAGDESAPGKTEDGGGATNEAGVSPSALRTTYRRRAIGSTARYPSSSSSMEKPLMGDVSPRLVRTACNARCQESASTQMDCVSDLPIDVSSTSQRMTGERPRVHYHQFGARWARHRTPRCDFVPPARRIGPGR
jgi:hypothetical protein